jgi:hypothetical protein
MYHKCFFLFFGVMVGNKLFAFSETENLLGFAAIKRTYVDSSLGHTQIFKYPFSTDANHTVLGVRVFASRTSAEAPISFGIYRPLPGYCTYKLVKLYALDITRAHIVTKVSRVQITIYSYYIMTLNYLGSLLIELKSEVNLIRLNEWNYSLIAE